MMLTRLLVTALLAASLGACAKLPYAKPPYTNVDNNELKTLIAQGVPVYDVRRAEEWRLTGVVAGSRMLTYVDKSGRPNPEFLPRFTAEAGKNDPVILICRTGNRTDKLARELMEKHGYTRIYNVRDGITRWIAENNAVIKTQTQTTLP